VLLLDNSAWSRLVDGAVDRQRAETIAGWVQEGSIATCLPFLLEAGYSARSAEDHRAMMSKLAPLPCFEITPRVHQSALQAQRDLVEVAHHRVAPIDVIIASCAHEAGAGVLHYDSDYDVLAERTSLCFDSEWLAPPGTL
jgi:predicted nucleic acid-binding protein